MNNLAKQIDLEQGSEEWLAFRRDKIGASECPIIMGVSKWTSPLQLWEEKVGIRKPKMLNSAMKRGHDLEESARMAYQSMTGIKVKSKVYQHNEYDWMICSLDGIDETETKIVEIKAPNKNDHDMAKRGIVPIHYVPQLMHQMEVCQVEKAHYFSFDGTEGSLVEIYRDEIFIKKMVKAEKEFFEKIQTFEAPELCDKDYEIRNDQLWTSVAKEWQEEYKEFKAKEKRLKELRQALIDLSGDKSSRGGNVRILRTVARGTIDYNSIPDLKNVNLEKYRKQPIIKYTISEE